MKCARQGLLIGVICALISAACSSRQLPLEATHSCQRTWHQVKDFPHDPNHFTQGLVMTEGRLYESTGLYGLSAIQEVSLDSGRRLRRRALPPTDFGEGLTRIGDRLIQLTWRRQRAWVYDLSLRMVGALDYHGEGWGLTTLGDQDAKHLVMSDGSHRLQVLEADGLKRVRSIEVRDRGRPVSRLNELEYVDGEVLANVWHSDTVVAIDPDSGQVRGRYDFSALRKQLRWDSGPPPEADLNGIALDARSGHLLVTGKRWPRLFEVAPGPCKTVDEIR
jgi:glutamine cyclotransferase